MPKPDEKTEQKSEETPDLTAISETLAAMQGELDNERTARAKLDGKLSAQLQAATAPQAPAAESAKTYSRSEIATAIQGGTITQLQGDQILEDQMRAAIRTESSERDVNLRASIKAEMTQESKKQAYIDSFPNLLVDGTADRERLQSAYSELITDGSPESAATELAAMRLAFGPPRTAGTDKTAESRETDQSGGGGRPANAGTGSEDPSAGLNITARQKSYYEQKIATGVYTGWDQVTAELESYKGATAA